MLYITYIALNDKIYMGVQKKVMSQVKAFLKVFRQVYYTTYCGQMLYLISGDTGEVVDKELALTRQECNQILLDWIEKYNISKTYIRYAFSDKWFIDFLKEQKERDIRSVLEFPTIPYDGELKDKRVIAEDQYYRKELYKYIDKATTFSNDDKVFGIPAIRLLNGIDVESHPLKERRKQNDKIILIAVASMAKWHGYERIIKGLAEYYSNNGQRNILLRLIGKGSELELYKTLTKNYKLQSHVEICGELTGEDLTEQYSQADIAIGSLGMYKIGLEQASPIKLSEYCVRGIPFVYGYTDLRFEGNEEYLLHVSNEDVSVNMQTVVDFYDQISCDKDISYKMRKDAIEKFSWKNILEPVIEDLDGCRRE